MKSEQDPWSDELLRRARGYLEPEAEDAARVLEAVREYLPEHAYLPERASSGSIRRPLELGAGAARGIGARAARSAGMSKLVGVGVVTGALGFLLGLSIGQRTGTQSVATNAAEQALLAVAPSSGAPAPEALRAHELEPASAASALAEPEAPALEHQPRQPPKLAHSRPALAHSAAPKSASATPPSGADGFREALELLRRAQAAQRLGRAGEAFEHLSELDRRFGAEVLREERLLTRILASCDVGDRKQAHELRAQLEQQNPSSIYTGRLQNSCAGTAEKPPQ